MDRQQHAQGYPNVNARGEIAVTMHRADGAVPRWEIAEGLVPYADAVAQMERDAAAIADRRVAERVWLVEHPPLLTFGTSGKPDDIRDARFPVFRSGRGGQVTYHGPGQRVVYVMLDLRDRRQDVRAFVAALEDWIIATLAEFNVRGERRQDRVGVWVGRPDKGAGYEDKIAAIGIRLRRWVSFHGIAINVEPELANFASIVPCGVTDPRYGVTSLVDLGLPVTMDDVDVALKKTFGAVF